MEVRSEVLDAITHAVAAARRRREGRIKVADDHSAAARRALLKITKAAPAEPARFVVRDRPGAH